MSDTDTKIDALYDMLEVVRDCQDKIQRQVPISGMVGVVNGFSVKVSLKETMSNLEGLAGHIRTVIKDLEEHV